MPLIVVAAALIAANRTILIQKRPPDRALGGLWEFPGGKREAGESSRAALIRELDEELGIGVERDDLVPCGFAVESRDPRELILLLFVCRRWQGDPEPLTASELRWVAAAQLADYSMPPADVPLAAGLVRYLSDD
jgi:8-oxo-dGTP diphosphatase